MAPGIAIITTIEDVSNGSHVSMAESYEMWHSRVVLSNRGPLALRDVRAPSLPVLAPLAVSLKAELLGGHNLLIVDKRHSGLQTGLDRRNLRMQVRTDAAQQRYGAIDKTLTLLEKLYRELKKVNVK